MVQNRDRADLQQPGRDAGRSWWVGAFFDGHMASPGNHKRHRQIRRHYGARDSGSRGGSRCTHPIRPLRLRRGAGDPAPTAEMPWLILLRKSRAARRGALRAFGIQSSPQLRMFAQAIGIAAEVEDGGAEGVRQNGRSYPDVAAACQARARLSLAPILRDLTVHSTCRRRGDWSLEVCPAARSASPCQAPRTWGNEQIV